MTGSLSLRQRIFWWSVGSTLIILLAVFFFVDRGLRSTIVASLEENVEAEARLTVELHRRTVEAALEQVANIAEAPTVRAAVETGDPATVRQNLEEFLAETRAAWLAAVSPVGRVIAFAGPAPVAQIEEARLLVQQARYYDTGDFWLVNDTLTQVSAGGVFFGEDLLGVLLMGEVMGDTQLERIEVSAEQRVAIVSDGRLVTGGTELSEADRAALLAAWTEDSPRTAAVKPDLIDTDSTEPVREFNLEAGPHLGMAQPLLGMNGLPAASLVAYRSLREAMAPARALRFALLTIAGGGIGLALVSSLGLSRTVTRPIDRLLGATVRLGSGDLEQPIERERDDEIGRLAEGFEAMRSSLAVAQRELLRAERLSAVGRAASGIVHDFRQPVSVIQARMDLLEDSQGDPEAREQDLAAIRSEIERLTTMMQEVLDFARGADDIDRAAGSVGRLLDDVATRYGPQLDAQDITLIVDQGYEGDWVLDFRRTGRVIENLVHNSAAATGAGGHIRVRSVADIGVLRIEVEDDGPGVPESLRENLFEPFVTMGKKHGTGLGLAMARSFTERQGGTIRYTTSDAGTTFVLEFPAVGDRDSETGGHT